MSKIIVGIDPGLSGAACVLYGCNAYAFTMPVTKQREVDASHLSSNILAYLSEHGTFAPDVVFIERQQTMPKQGIASSGKCMMNYGILLGAIQAWGWPVQIVLPQAWKKRVLAGYASKDKDAAIDFVRKRYPQVCLTPGRCTKPHDGIADAVCIAHYGLVSEGGAG